MRPETLKGHLDLLLLAVVASDSAHGYAIIRTLRDFSGGLLDLPEGTIYPALHRLEEAGLLASDWSEGEGRRRRVYRVTPQGQAALDREQSDWSEFARAVEAVLEAAT